MKRSISNRSSVLQSTEEKEVSGRFTGQNYCPMLPRSKPIDIPTPSNEFKPQPQPQSKPHSENDLLIASYHETVGKLRDIRGKLYHLGIDPEKLSN